jgi:hypothetical protein
LTTDRAEGVLGEDHGHGVAEASFFAADVDEELVDVGTKELEAMGTQLLEGPLGGVEVCGRRGAIPQVGGFRGHRLPACRR